MKKTIYIIRHGQTDYNKQELVQGSGIDAPLNETGKAQAAAFYQFYKDVHFQKVYITELQRTHQTGEGFIKKKIPTEVLPGLNEMFYGELEGQPIFRENGNGVEEVKAAWNIGKCNTKMPGGESPEDVQARQRPAMQKIVDSPEDLVLVVMHSRALRILLCTLLGKELKEMESFPMPNSCLYILEYDVETKEYACQLSGSVEHLEGVSIPA